MYRRLNSYISYNETLIQQLSNLAFLPIHLNNFKIVILVICN